MNILWISAHSQGEKPMSVMVRDAAALVVLVSFAATVTLWSDLIARMV